MKYKVGDWVLCEVETSLDNKRKLYLANLKKDSKLEKLSFPIVAIDKNMQTYKIIIEYDMTGWEINHFHIRHQNVDKKSLGKRFYDITETFILGPGKKRDI